MNNQVTIAQLQWKHSRLRTDLRSTSSWQRWWSRRSSTETANAQKCTYAQAALGTTL